jgi:exopolysaccharide biosynthesis polyprenyl glycosylphosphotransferase
MIEPRSHIRVQSACIVLIDLACLVLGGAISVTARIGTAEFPEYVIGHLDGWIVFFGSVILANYLAGAYTLQNTFSRFNLIVTWAFSLIFSLVVLSITSYAWFTVLLGRGVLFLWIVSYGTISLTLRILVYKDLFRSPMFLCRVLVIGCGDRARELRRMMENPFVMPAHRVVGFVRTPESGQPKGWGGAELDGVPVINASLDELAEVTRTCCSRLVVLGHDDPSRVFQLSPQMRRLRFSGVEIMSALSVAELYAAKTPLDLVSEESLTQASLESGLPIVGRAKRLLDIMIGLVGSIVFGPLALAVIVISKVTDPRSPVFYTQVRVGRFGTPFNIYKFRTMRPDAEQLTGPVWAAVDDPRVTRLGRFLRRYRLDEIPQILNILRGEMSVVGPRPERPAIGVELARRIPFFSERENVPPGLTGWAQIRYPYGSSLEDAMRKLEYDLYYIKHMSLSLDLQIILSTMRIVLFGKERKV